MFIASIAIGNELNEELSVPQSVKEVIKAYEGWRSHAYKDSGGENYAIGYGQSTKNRSMKITREEGELMFNRTIERLEKKVKEFIKVPITQYQFSVIVDMCYNIGSGKIKKSTMIRLLNKGQYDLAGAQIKRWVHANGKVLRGLVKRRNWNYCLWVQEEAIKYNFCSGNESTSPVVVLKQKVKTDVGKEYYGYATYSRWPYLARRSHARNTKGYVKILSYIRVTKRLKCTMALRTADAYPNYLYLENYGICTNQYSPVRRI